MRSRITILAMLAAVSAVSNAQVVRVQRHEGASDPWGKYFNASQQSTITGRVHGIATAKISGGEDKHVTILVQKGSTITPVELGPGWYVDDQDAKIHMGEEVQVTGSWVSAAGQPEMMASQVRLRGQGGPVLALRRLSGRAYWMPEEVVASEPAKNKTVATTEEQTPTETPVAMAPPPPPAMVQINNGMQNISTGAVWYPWGNQVFQTAPYVNMVNGAYPFTFRPF